MPRKSARDKILNAAERVIQRQGLAATTIEAVAAEAGVSKGGLFYHFSSKKEMLEQLIDHYREWYYASREEILATLPDTPGKLLKATILASIKHPARSTSNVSNLVALLDDIDLRKKISLMKREIYDELISHSGVPERIAIAILAIDGLWFAEILGENTLSPGLKQRIIDEMLRLIDANEHCQSTSNGAV